MSGMFFVFRNKKVESQGAAIQYKSKMITSLPCEIVDLIYQKLPVQDRARLMLTIPKKHISKTYNPNHEKRLHIIHKSVQKKRISTLSQRIVSFLTTTYEEDEPTLNEIDRIIPFKTDTSLARILMRMQKDTITLSDIENIDITDDVKQAIYKSSVPSFKVLFDYERTREIILTSSSMSFMFNIFNYENGPLIEYLKSAEGSALYDWDWNYAQERVKDMHYMFGYPSMRKLIFDNLSFTREELAKIWEQLMQSMNIEAAMEIDKKMSEI